MLFNSLDFALFLPIVFLLYWFVFNKRLGVQNVLLLVASYVFYGWWDWRFLSLILFSSGIDFMVGIQMDKQQTVFVRKLWLSLSLVVNIGLLGFFKYYNFFVESFVDAFSFFGHPIGISGLHIILPVGISFYTFQTLSYSIDIYNRKLQPTRNPIEFFAFVSFFPQLVAGPIERAASLLPQFQKERSFDYTKAVDGLRQVLWGLFKKVVIADTCASYVNMVYNNSDMYGGSTLIIASILFAFQIYGDFSGYSDIAIGVSRLFGFNLMRNFAFPYFSRDMAEFWRRWHISLSTWFRDYLYIPLGGSRGSMFKKIRNVFVIFVVSGFWHGANWTFVIWGALNALYFIPLLITNQNRKHVTQVVAQNKWFPNLREFLAMNVTFALTVFAWIFFRSMNIQHAIQILSEIFSPSLFSMPFLPPKSLALFLLLFIGVEWMGRNTQYALESIYKFKSRTVRYAVYYVLILVILIHSGGEQEFIYFQF